MAGATDALRTPGRRLTAQRVSIWETLVAHAGRHISASELANAIPELHRSTVYRTLDVLVEDGLVRRTDLGGDRSYYELASDHPHHHVVCSECGRIVHVHDDAVAAMFALVEAASGFRLARRELTFAGLCPACSG